MTKEKIKNLPKPVKEAIAHAYKELGFSHRKIAELMGVDPKTILRYQHKELDDEWEQFASTIKKIYLEQDFELAQLAYQKMKEKIGKAKFYELVGLYKTVRELQKPQTPLVVNQTIFTQLKQKYGQL
jgi:predicted transcriptional regulator